VPRVILTSSRRVNPNSSFGSQSILRLTPSFALVSSDTFTPAFASTLFFELSRLVVLNCCSVFYTHSLNLELWLFFEFAWLCALSCFAFNYDLIATLLLNCRWFNFFENTRLYALSLTSLDFFNRPVSLEITRLGCTHWDVSCVFDASFEMTRLCA
jgi:hypothetical protein